jgi:hypothetical protein
MMRRKVLAVGNGGQGVPDMHVREREGLPLACSACLSTAAVVGFRELDLAG